MKQFILACVTATLLFGCSSKNKRCPVCMGEGSLVVYGTKEVCISCNGEGMLSNEEYVQVLRMLKDMETENSTNADNIYDSEELETCPFCDGRGSNGAYTCSFCNGAGQVTASAAAQGRHVRGGGSVKDFYPSTTSGSSSNSSTTSRGCKSCNYSGDCQHCQGVGVVYYHGQYNTEDGYMKCPICKGTKRCNVCN